jgi:triacylglycerol lipase
MRARRVVASALIAVVCAASPSGATTTPLFTVPRAELAAATHCDASLTAGTAKRAVLLVHGTGATPEEAWGWNYQIALRRLGYGICTVRLPDRGFANLYTSAQYVAYAARAAYRVSSRRIAILGHSQGGLLSVWVAKFWPDIARRASDVITLAAPVHGTRLANTLCATRLCATAAWQQRAG